jgi:hypothetical protein
MKIIVWLILLLLLALPASAQTSPALSLPVSRLETGQTADLPILIDCFTCRGVDLILSYDPQFIAIEAVSPGGFLGANPRMPARGNVIDSDGGTVRVSLLRQDSAIALDQVLFTLRVRAVQPGESRLDVISLTLIGGSGTPQINPGSVLVSAPTPTATLTPSTTPTPPPSATPTFTRTPSRTPRPQPCRLIAPGTGVPVYVGPSTNRTIRRYIDNTVSALITGQAADDQGNLWWRILPAGVTTEQDRYWVLQSQVSTYGDCTIVEEVGASPVVISVPRNPTAATASSTFSPISVSAPTSPVQTGECAPSSTRVVTTTFINQTSDTYSLYLLDPACNEIFWFTLEPGMTTQQQSILTQRWRMRWNGQLVLESSTRFANGTFIIRPG